MSILDNSTAPPAAASEPSAAPLPEHLPGAPAEASPSAAAPNSALSVPATGEEAPAAALVLEPCAEQSAQKQRGRPFEPGQSGNPNGRPKGARNRVTRAVEALIDGEGEADSTTNHLRNAKGAYRGPKRKIFCIPSKHR